MVWTGPVPLISYGEVASSAEFDTYFVDNLNYLVDTSGGLQPTAEDNRFGTGAQGGPGSYLDVQTASATAVGLLALGSEADIDIAVVPKGVGVVSLESHDVFLGDFDIAPTDASRLHVQTGPTGVGFVAEGEHADLDLSFTPKGAGVVALESHDTYLGDFDIGPTDATRLHAATGPTAVGFVAEGEPDDLDIFLRPQGGGVSGLEDGDGNIVAAASNSRFDTFSPIFGTRGGNAPQITTRAGGHDVSFTWDGGTHINVWLDDTDLGQIV